MLVWSTPLGLHGRCGGPHAPTFNKWHKKRRKKKNEKKKVALHMLNTTRCEGRGVTSLVVCINDKNCDIKERNMTIRSKINYEHLFPRVSGY